MLREVGAATGVSIAGLVGQYLSSRESTFRHLRHQSTQAEPLGFRARVPRIP